MEFPAYVPAAVRAHIATLIEGDEWEPHGWATSLANAESELAGIEGAIETRTRRGEVEYLDSLRKQRADAVKHRDMLAGNVDCLQRLAHDSRMCEAFAVLTREFTKDEQWRGFIYAAWAARMDYGPFRERLKRAAELRDEIAKTSKTLAQLLRQASGVGISNWPAEFFSIPELLRRTDNHEMQGHDLYMWQALRPHVLGDPPRGDIPEGERPHEDGHSASASVIVVREIIEAGNKPETDPAEQGRATLRYAWGKSPPLSALLDTVAEAARGFKPSEYGMIGAAIESRQRSIKTEYLRAFGNLLTDVHHMTLTTAVMQAMATVANVAINLPDDVDVTYDDVRKALARLGGDPLENSEKK